MPLISPIIKSIVKNYIPDGLYMRNSEIDANIDLDQIDMEGKFIVIYYNLPTVAHSITYSTSVVRHWPVEILIAKLANVDNDGEDGDEIRSECLGIADLILDHISKNAIVSQVESIEDYDIQFENSVNVFDKTLTGCRMTCTVPIDRTEYYC